MHLYTKSRFLTYLSQALLLLAATSWAVPQDAQTPSDRDQIRQVVKDTYAAVLYDGGPTEKLRRGLHSSYRMFVLSNDEVQTRDLETWIARLEQRRAQRQPSASQAENSITFELIDVAGPAAVVKLLASRDGSLRYTDFLTLYKFEEGWRITTKTFAQH